MISKLNCWSKGKPFYCPEDSKKYNFKTGDKAPVFFVFCKDYNQLANEIYSNISNNVMICFSGINQRTIQEI